MKIAVVGNRVGWDKEFVLKKLKELEVEKHDIIISGGAEGVDTYAQEFAKQYGCQIRIFYPDPEAPSPQRYFDRNEQIAMTCDKMVAFDLNGNVASGTKNAISHAKKFGKELVLIEGQE
ncbi:DUF2493 domain-containing protein [Candidatus Woesearchaeota archaeon]|nr:DUF2493 domain-containing protein [Candidatus Woesearchaeota archaeon]